MTPPALRVLVLADPLESLVAGTDTTLAIAQELEARGHHVRFCTPSDLSVDHDELIVGTTPVEEFDAVLVRLDPPVDSVYLHVTHLLDLLSPSVVVVNSPAGLRNANEKLFTLAFPQLTPDTIVSADPEHLRRFQAEMGGAIVVKPLDGCGGRGVVHLDGSERGARAVLDLLTGEGERPVMAQRQLDVATTGDKRIFLLDGEPAGALLRLPAAGELRANLHQGATPALTVLDARELEICRLVGARCVAEGLRFAGLDVIDGYLTEVNVTSPTGFRELSALGGVRLDRVFADWLQRACARRSMTPALALAALTL